mmetsp:Transcript_30588/g.81396  ORF Transcript_30588/g.81396 Transcript_30588/m.81396 type:complete len:112 (-) Transcript_30588:556-891(-)
MSVFTAISVTPSLSDERSVDANQSCFRSRPQPRAHKYTKFLCATRFCDPPKTIHLIKGKKNQKLCRGSGGCVKKVSVHTMFLWTIVEYADSGHCVLFSYQSVALKINRDAA